MKEKKIMAAFMAIILSISVLLPESSAEAAICTFCHGKGYTECIYCSGTGYRYNGVTRLYERCIFCNGRPKRTCIHCGGTGRTKSSSSSSSSSKNKSNPKLSKKKLVLIAKNTAKLSVSGTTKKVKWSSSNKKIAKVNSKGKVTAKKAGKCTITAKVGTKKLKCKVTVKKRITVSKVTLSKTNANMVAGETLKLTASISPKNVNVSYKASWKSSNTSVASVSNDGTVTAVSAGSAKITYTAGGKSASCTVSIVSAMDHFKSQIVQSGVKLEEYEGVYGMAWEDNSDYGSVYFFYDTIGKEFLFIQDEETLQDQYSWQYCTMDFKESLTGTVSLSAKQTIPSAADGNFNVTTETTADKIGDVWTEYQWSGDKGTWGWGDIYADSCIYDALSTWNRILDSKFGISLTGLGFTNFK